MCKPGLHTGYLYKAVPRLRECGRQVETEVVSNSRNKVHQTWDRPYSTGLYVISLWNYVVSPPALVPIL